MDKKALNYDKDVNINDKKSCKYPYKGCMDLEATNYNVFANVSCTEDCEKWLDDQKNLDIFKNKLAVYKKDPKTFKIKIRELEEKIRRMTQNVGKYDKLCDFHRPCTIKKLRSFQDRECPECRCIPVYKGCNREWCVNYNKNETRDITSITKINKLNDKTDFANPYGCIDIRDLLNRLYILCSGNCLFCDDKVIIKLDEKYIINEKRDGLYLMIVKRNQYFDDYQHFRFLNGNDLIKKLSIADPTDIIIFTAKMNSTSYLSDQNKIDLYNKLNAQKIDINRGDNYILITSLEGDIHYEDRSSSTEVYFPSYKIDCIGCYQIDNNLTQKLNPENKLILKTDKLNMSSDEFIYRCALEASSSKKDGFMIKDNQCYVFTEDIVNTEGIVKPKFGGYIVNNNPMGDEFKYVKKGSYVNRNAIGNLSDNSGVVYHISDTFFSNIEIFDAEGEGNTVNVFTNPKFKGLQINLNSGINSIKKLLNLNYADTTMSGISSLKIPNNYLVTLLKPSNNKKISITGGASRFKQINLGKTLVSDQTKTQQTRIHELAPLMSTLISSPSKEFLKNVKYQVALLTNENKIYESDSKKLDYSITTTKKNLTISVKDSFYSIVSRTAGWTSKDDDTIIRIFLSLNNMLFDVMDSISKTNPEVLTDSEKNIVKKSKEINSKLKTEKTKLDRYILIKGNILKRTREEILGLYSIKDIENQIETREKTKSSEVDNIIYNGFVFLKMVLEDIENLEKNKNATHFPNIPFVILTDKRLELFSTFSKLKDSNQEFNEINQKTDKNELDNILISKYSDYLPQLIEILNDQTIFLYPNTDNNVNLRLELNKKTNVADMTMSSITDAKINYLIINDPDASIIKKGIDNLNAELVKLNDQRKSSTVDYLLKNTYVPFTKGETLQLSKDPNFKRLPDSSRIQLEEGVIKNKEQLLYLLKKKNDYENLIKINKEKITFLNNIKKDLLDDLEFTTSKNDDLIMITNITNRVVLYELNNLNGMALPIPFGRYSLPKNYWMTIGSIHMIKKTKVNNNICVTLFSDQNFEKEIGFFTNFSNQDINDTNSFIVGEKADGSPLLYNRMQLVKSVIVEYLSNNYFYRKVPNKKNGVAVRVTSYISSSLLRATIRSLRSPIIRILINQPRHLYVLYSKVINSWGQEDEKIAGYVYNEFYDKPKEVDYLIDPSRNKIKLSLVEFKVSDIKSKHLTEELLLKYKV